MARKPSLNTGDLFQNQYEILGVLGAGGHAFVYRVYNQILAREQALKLIEMSPDARPDRRRRARLEAQALCRLRHPNLVGGEGAGVAEDGSIFILMELLRGPSLRAIIDEHRQVLPAEALLICAQIAEGVHAAHQHGIVHRDLKPENVIVEPGNRARVIDFGIAKFDATDAQTTQRALVQGTTWYMSPEHIQGMAVTPRSDIFALGTIFYELVAGLRPTLVGLEVVDPNTLNYRLLYVMPPYLDELVPGVPAYVADFVQAMLAKNPDDRPESMALVALAFREHAARLHSDAGDSHNAVRDLALVTAIKPRGWGSNHTTSRAEPLRAESLPAEPLRAEPPRAEPLRAESLRSDEPRAISQRALHIASVVHPDPALSQSGERIAPVVATSVARAHDVPSAPLRLGDSGRRTPTGPGYAREIPVSERRSALLAGVTSDPLWTRVVAAAVLTGSLLAVVVVTGGLRIYRAASAYTATDAGSSGVRSASLRAKVSTSKTARADAMPQPALAPVPAFVALTAPNEESREAFVTAPASSVLPAPAPFALPPPPLSALPVPAPVAPQPAGRRQVSMRQAPRAAARNPASTGLQEPVLSDESPLPASGLSEASPKRAVRVLPKRSAASAPPRAPTQDKDGRINLFFPPRRP